MNWEDIIKSNIKDMVSDLFGMDTKILEDDLGYVPLDRKRLKKIINEVAVDGPPHANKPYPRSIEVSGYVFSYKEFDTKDGQFSGLQFTIRDKSSGKKLVVQRLFQKRGKFDRNNFYDTDSSE